MKARDLAALAALGVAGYAAYNKFGKKGDEPKTRGKLGESQSANDGTAGETENYSNEGRGKNAKFTDEDYSNEGRNAKFANEDYSNEGRGKVKKEIEYPLFPRPVAKKETVAKPVVQRSNEDFSNEGRNSRRPTVVTMPAGDDRFVTPEEGAKAYVPRRIPGAADGVGSTFSSSAEGMEDYVPRRVAPAATFSSTEEGMQKYVPRRPGQAPVASSTAAGMAAYVPRNTAATAQAKLDALRSSGGRRAKGGVVKMASGGMTSSKSSGASRGDGIAQRGRTRGTLR